MSSANNVEMHPLCQALERTFVKKAQLDQKGYLLFGSGPNIHPVADDVRPMQFKTEISVFPETGDYVRGVQDMLHRGYLLAYGGQYLAFISSDKIRKGGRVCSRDIMPTGRQIVGLCYRKEYDNMLIFYADGSADFVEVTTVRKKRVVRLKERRNLPALHKNDTVTACVSDESTSLIGTSKGRMFCVDWRRGASFSLMDNSIKSPVKACFTCINSRVYRLVLLHFDGTIVFACGKPHGGERILSAIRGRFTCLTGKFNGEEPTGREFFLAGDQEGTIWKIDIDWERDTIHVAGRIKGAVPGGITNLLFRNDNEFIVTTAMGAVHCFQSDRLHSRGDLLSHFIKEAVVHRKPKKINLRNFCRTWDGYYYLTEDGLSLCYVTDELRYVYRERQVLKKQNKLKMRSFMCIRAMLSIYMVVIAVRSLSENSDDRLTVKEAVFHDSGRKNPDGTPIPIVQMFPMKNHVLICFADGCAVLGRFNLEKKTMTAIKFLTAEDRILSFGVIEYPNEKPGKYGYVIGYENLGVKVGLGELDTNRAGIGKLPMSLRGGRVVSILSSQKHLGTDRFALLTDKGTLFVVTLFISKPSIVPRVTHMVSKEIQLKRVIGGGHSLVETTTGILVLGFKQTILSGWHVASLEEAVPTEGVHVFSVATKGRRHPFTVVEEFFNACVEPTPHFTVAYPNWLKGEDQIFEKTFPLPRQHAAEHLSHTGTVKCGAVSCLPNAGRAFTGDSDGNIFMWTLGSIELTTAGYQVWGSCRLNGAITSIVSTKIVTIAASSQGEVTLLRMSHAGLLTTVPYNFNKKIDLVMPYPNDYDHKNNPYPLFLICFADGDVRRIRCDAATFTPTTTFLEEEKVAQFPDGFKAAMIVEQDGRAYLVALGVDNILRRVVSKEVTELQWEITTMASITNETHEFLSVGEPDGRLHLIVNSKKRDSSCGYFYIDHIHRAEIIDIAIVPDGAAMFHLISVDMAGTVVIRKFCAKSQYRFVLTDFPFKWISAVPSPKKLLIFKNPGTVAVLGRGISSRLLPY